MFALPYIFGIIPRMRSKLLHSSVINNITQKTSGRPPNILIYTGKNDKNSETFIKTKEVVTQCLAQDKYVIYQLKDESVLEEPWKENTELLILASDHILEKSYENTFDNYIKDGGKLLGFSKFYSLNNTVRLCDVGSVIEDIHLCENLKKYDQRLHVPAINTFYEVEDQENVDILAVSLKGSQPIILGMSHGDGIAIISSAQISTDDTLDDKIKNERNELLKALLTYLGLTCGVMKQSVLTNGYLLGDEKSKKVFMISIQDVLIDKCFKGNTFNIAFTENTEASASHNNFPVITNAELDETSFKLSLYKKHLTAKHLGQLVIYSDVITSTQTILNESLKLVRKLPEGYGLVLVGNQQTLGKGRGGNAWLSPDGCICFSFPLHIELDSNLGQRLPFVQHIAALAAVDAIRNIKGYENIDVRIKWPNDIYYGKDKKIGGILVNSSIQGRSAYAVVGIGMNLDNSEPTTCINDLIKQTNLVSNMTLTKLSREQLIARILNAMEELFEDFQESGPKFFLERYYQRWLHSDAKVNLWNENGEVVTIKGLDDMGFLSVVNSLNEIQSVQPDGNSFDMMQNLITIKTRK